MKRLRKCLSFLTVPLFLMIPIETAQWLIKMVEDSKGNDTIQVLTILIGSIVFLITAIFTFFVTLVTMEWMNPSDDASF